MKISKTMVKNYLGYLTVGYFGENDEPAEDLESYAPVIENIELLAKQSGDLHWFTLGLSHLLTSPGVDWSEYDGGHYPFTPEEVEDIVTHVWTTLSPGQELTGAGEGPTIELVEMSGDEWREYRESLTSA